MFCRKKAACLSSIILIVISALYLSTNDQDKLSNDVDWRPKHRFLSQGSESVNTPSSSGVNGHTNGQHSEPRSQTQALKDFLLGGRENAERMENDSSRRKIKNTQYKTEQRDLENDKEYGLYREYDYETSDKDSLSHYKDFSQDKDTQSTTAGDKETFDETESDDIAEDETDLLNLPNENHATNSTGT